jgi:cation transport regulator ChaC
MTDKVAILYFAYGSNMLTKRLHERIPNARPCGIAVLREYEFNCNKKSKDGSSKGNIAPLKDAVTWGVIFELPEKAISILDKAEGGYTRNTVSVSISGKVMECETYISQEISTEPPYDWYLNYIIEGAREHGLPEDYVLSLSRIKGKANKRNRK